MHTLTMSHPPMRNVRQQLRLLPLILSKIYYGVKLDSKFWLSKKLENEWDIIFSLKNEWDILFSLFYDVYFLYSSLLIGHLRIMYLSKLFRHKSIVMIRSIKFFSSAPFPGCNWGYELEEGITGRGQNNLRKTRENILCREK